MFCSAGPTTPRTARAVGAAARGVCQLAGALRELQYLCDHRKAESSHNLLGWAATVPTLHMLAAGQCATDPELLLGAGLAACPFHHRTSRNQIAVEVPVA